MRDGEIRIKIEHPSGMFIGQCEHWLIPLFFPSGKTLTDILHLRQKEQSTFRWAVLFVFGLATVLSAYLVFTYSFMGLIMYSL